MVHDKLEFKCCIRDMKKVIFTHQSDTVTVRRRSAVTVPRWLSKYSGYILWINNTKTLSRSKTEISS